ncbi:MAG TPA: FecR domain-containing protein [Gemmatimonadaceae bacterium]
MSSHRFEHLDLDLLYRFAAGAASPDEHERVAAWLAEDAERGVLLDALAAMAERPEELSRSFDAGSARAKLERELAALDGDAVEASAPRMVMRARVSREVARPRVAPFTTAASGGWRRVAVAAGIVALLAGGVWWVGARGGIGGGGGAPVEHDYATTRGQLMRFRLPDGTGVTLGAASRLHYAEGGGAGAREARLEGEAEFEVVHDERHPFVVRAGGAVARDIGTTFGVRAYPGDSAASVVVAEGSVSLSTEGEGEANQGKSERVLEAGELGRVARGGTPVVERVNAARYLAWTEGRLEFDDVPLRDVAAQLARWYDVDIVLADSALAGRRFTGAFQGETVEQVLDALAPPLHVRYERRGRTVVLHALPNDH